METFEFEWDEEKNIINKRKHGIDFNIAIHVFDDEDRIEIFDVEHSLEEDRIIQLDVSTIFCSLFILSGKTKSVLYLQG